MRRNKNSIEKNGFAVLEVFLTIAAVILIIIGGFFEFPYLKFQKTQEVAKPLAVETITPPSPSAEAQPQPKEIDTSTWKTYRNEKYGFEVKYPSDLKADEGKISIYKEFSTHRHGVGFSMDLRTGGAYNEFEIYILSGHEIDNFNTGSQGSRFMNRERLEFQRMPGTISVSGIPAIEVNVSLSSLRITEPYYIKNVYFPKDGVIYIFVTETGFEDLTPEESQKRTDRFYQMLSTFKFIK